MKRQIEQGDVLDPLVRGGINRGWLIREVVEDEEQGPLLVVMSTYCGNPPRIADHLNTRVVNVIGETPKVTEEKVEIGIGRLFRIIGRFDPDVPEVQPTE